MKQIVQGFSLGRKANVALLAMHAADSPLALASTSSELARHVIGASGALLIFSRGPGFRPKALRCMEGQRPGVLRLDPSWPTDPLVQSLRQPDRMRPIPPGELAATPELSRSPFFTKRLNLPGQKLIAVIPVRHVKLNLVVLCLFRPSTDPTDPAEMQKLAWFYPHFSVAVRRVLFRDLDLTIRWSIQNFVRQSPTGLLVLNWDLKVLYSNPAAHQACSLWSVGPEASRQTKATRETTLPAEVLERCAGLKREFKDAGLDPEHVAKRSIPVSAETLALAAERSIRCPRHDGLRALVRLTSFNSGSLEKPVFQIRFEYLAAAPRRGPGRGKAIQAHMAALSVRERELLPWVCQGLSNEEVSKRVSKSVMTVKNQLKSIYRKLGISSRGELIARLHAVSRRGARR